MRGKREDSRLADTELPFCTALHCAALYRVINAPASAQNSQSELFSINYHVKIHNSRPVERLTAQHRTRNAARRRIAAQRRTASIRFEPFNYAGERLNRENNTAKHTLTELVMFSTVLIQNSIDSGRARELSDRTNTICLICLFLGCICILYTLYEYIVEYNNGRLSEIR